MRIRSIVASGALALAVVGGSVAGAGAASAQYTPVPGATGSVALAAPLQYMSFNVYAGYGPYYGSVGYANFDYTYAGVNTNVWNISGPHTLYLAFPFGRYSGTMNVTAITPTSTHSTTFYGTFSYWFHRYLVSYPVSGTVDWNAVSFTIFYHHGYKVTAYGSIKSDGSVYGVARNSYSLKTWFRMSAGSTFQVFRYTAPVTSASITDHTVTFGYTVPTGIPFAGTPITVNAYDGGHGYQSDTLAINGAPYQITSGFIFVRH